MENRKCVKCMEDINPLRIKALPNTKTCVNCSTVGAKKGVSMMFGEKDYTWNDMVIIEPEEVKTYVAQEESYLDEIEDELEEDKEKDKEEEEDDLKDWDNTLLDGLEDL
jgi:RNA polymerase-binding transcription factor DksA